MKWIRGKAAIITHDVREQVARHVVNHSDVVQWG